MSAGHYVLLEGDAGCVRATFICEASAIADCHRVPVCSCDNAHTEACVERYPKGPPKRRVAYCNHKEWIDAEGDVWSASGGKVRVPVTTFWDGETYVWDFDGASS